MFRSTGYRKYVCDACAEVSIELRGKCMVDISMLNKMQAELKHNAALLDKMEKELSSNSKVILSSEQACETFRRLAVDKDAFIAQ